MIIIDSPIRSTLDMTNPRFRRAVERFVVRIPQDMQAMDLAWRHRDLRELERLAHRLKGTGGTLGFGCFTEPALRLEQMLKAQQFDGIEYVLAELKQLAYRVASPQGTPNQKTVARKGVTQS